MRRATQTHHGARHTVHISIHALREEGDLISRILVLLAQDISIHALREEGDSQLATDGTSKPKFLSTPSARRATRYLLLAATNICISIHALREEGDYSLVRVSMCIIRFLSTPSARRAT